MHFNGCRACPSYNRGAGTEQCFKCQRYKEIIDLCPDRDTIRVVHLPSAIMEEVADLNSSDKGMLWAIRKLDIKEAAVLLCQYYGRMTIDEMCEAFGVSRTIIDRRLKKARIQLKIILSEKNQAVESDEGF